MNERIKAVRKRFGLKQAEFGSRIGLTPSGISKIESADSGVSNAVLLAIEREFGVDDNWLRTGEGEMLRPTSRDEELAAFFGELQGSTPDFRHSLISVLSRLSVDEWAMLERKALELLDEIKKSGL